MDDLDTILNKRVVPQARTNLADQIIARAQTPQVKRPDIFSTWLNNLFAQPAYVLTFSFMLILAAGIYFTNSSSTSQLVVAQEDALMDDIAMYMVYDTLMDAGDVS